MAAIVPATDAEWEFVHLALYPDFYSYSGSATKVKFIFRVNAAFDRVRSLVTGESAWEDLQATFERECRTNGVSPIYLELYRKTQERFIGLGPVGFDVDWENHYHVTFIARGSPVIAAVVALLVAAIIGIIVGYKLATVLFQSEEDINYPAIGAVSPTNPPADWGVMGTRAYPLADDYEGESQVLNAEWVVPLPGDGWGETSFSALADRLAAEVTQNGGQPLLIQILRITQFDIEIAGTVFGTVRRYLAIVYVKPSPIAWAAIIAAIPVIVRALVVLAAFAAFVDFFIRGPNSVLYPSLDFVRAVSKGLAFAFLPLAALVGGVAILISLSRRQTTSVQIKVPKGGQ